MKLEKYVAALSAADGGKADDVVEMLLKTMNALRPNAIEDGCLAGFTSDTCPVMRCVHRSELLTPYVVPFFCFQLHRACHARHTT